MAISFIDRSKADLGRWHDDFSHWSNTSDIQSGNFLPDNSSNAFIIQKNEDQEENRLPEQLISQLMEYFSYPEVWVLSKCKGILTITEPAICTLRKPCGATVAHEFQWDRY